MENTLEVVNLNDLSIKELESLVGRTVRDVKVKNKYAEVLFSGEGQSDTTVKILRN